MLEDSLTITDTLLIPMLFYLVWQAVYLVLTEHIMADYIRSDPEIIISRRHLARDKTNVMHRLVKKISRSLGIMGKDEDYKPESSEGKAIFLVAQFLYTMVTLLLYSNYHLSLAWFALSYAFCIWRGATVYIEVYTKKYNVTIVPVSDYRDVGVVNSEALDNELFTLSRKAK